MQNWEACEFINMHGADPLGAMLVKRLLFKSRRIIHVFYDETGVQARNQVVLYTKGVTRIEEIFS